MQSSYEFIATNFGWLYLLGGVAALVLSLWLALGRYGKVVLAILPLTLMYIGGLKVAQTAVLVVSLPILFTGVLSTCSLLLSLKEDHS